MALSGSRPAAEKMRTCQPSAVYPGIVRAPSLSDLFSSNSCDRSMSVTAPIPSQRGHMPPVTAKVRFSVLPAPLSIVIDPDARIDGMLNEKAFGDPTWGLPRRLHNTRSIALVSV